MTPEINACALSAKMLFAPSDAGMRETRSCVRASALPKVKGLLVLERRRRSFSFDFAGSAVVQHAEVVVPSQKAGHLPYLYGEFRTCFRVDVEQPASRSQSIV